MGGSGNFYKLIIINKREKKKKNKKVAVLKYQFLGCAAIAISVWLLLETEILNGAFRVKCYGFFNGNQAHYMPQSVSLRCEAQRHKCLRHACSVICKVQRHKQLCHASGAMCKDQRHEWLRYVGLGGASLQYLFLTQECHSFRFLSAQRFKTANQKCSWIVKNYRFTIGQIQT